VYNIGASQSTEQLVGNQIGVKILMMWKNLVHLAQVKGDFHLWSA
jgi:hypothetical protein